MEYSEEVLEKAKMAVEIGNAILQGKEVQFEDSDSWEHSDTPSLNFSSYNYRVKPQPKYVPFTFEDAKDLIGKAVIKKGATLVKQIIVVNENEVGFDANNVSFQSLLEFYTFLDDTPCGKLENQ